MSSLALMLCAAALALLGASADDYAWWQKKPIYQLYPSAFMDSDGNGMGDIEGIISKVDDYLKHLGVGAILLNPIYPSSYWDGGYDVKNYTDIEPSFGNLSDFQKLISKLNATEDEDKIRLIMDWVPNHSSDKHPWFISSLKNDSEYKDWYVWADGPNGSATIPPNNWLSVFGGSAWTYKAERKQWYYHAFSLHQPDLNWRSESLKKNMTGAMEFWLDNGVFGFRIDAAPFLVEDKMLRDEKVLCEQDKYECRDHSKTTDQEETFDVLGDIRTTLDGYNKGDKGQRIMIAESYSPIVMDYYQHNGKKIAHMPFNFQLITRLNKKSKGKDFVDAVHFWMKNMTGDRWPNWVLGNHDNSRVGTRMGDTMIDAMNTISLMLPGTAFIYYGEEIGMTDATIREDKMVDPQGRDPERTPMQWTSEMNAGFSNTNKTTWLPLNPNYWWLNVKKQEEAKKSHLSIVKDLIKLQSDLISNGTVNVTDFGKDYQFGFIREKSESQKYIVIVNFNDVTDNINVSSHFDKIPGKLAVRLSSLNSEKKNGDTLDPNEIKMRPGEALVLSTVAQSGGSKLAFSIYVLLVASLFNHLW